MWVSFCGITFSQIYQFIIGFRLFRLCWIFGYLSVIVLSQIYELIIGFRLFRLCRIFGYLWVIALFLKSANLSLVLSYFVCVGFSFQIPWLSLQYINPLQICPFLERRNIYISQSFLPYLKQFIWCYPFLELSMDQFLEVGKDFIETAVTELVGAINIIYSSTTWRKELKEKLLLLKPNIDGAMEIISDSDSSAHRYRRFKDFQTVLQDGFNLVDEGDNMHIYDIYGKWRYGRRIREFQEKIKDLIDTQGSPILAHDLQKLSSEVTDLRRRLEAATIDEQSVSYTSSYTSQEVPDMPNFVVGLDNRINAVKEILLQNDVDRLGITGMGGSGKTTLASAVCNNTQVKASFQNNIFFIPVKQSNPNVKGLLETMWDKIIGGQRPEFQSIEDAHDQLKKKLRLRPYRPTLVVLDDVWSTSSLEYLLFEAKGYKTIITTRQDSTIRVTDSTRLYNMPLLEDANALSLFCCCAFGQTSIPTTEKEDLVKQVAAECKGLPLALKVIGSSLRGKPRPIWRNAERKLSKAESISEYHKESLLKRLETSIDVLDDKHKQCFLDLGAFPKSRKFSVESLLDIWVYVREMEWTDAFEVLLELASRNLLNLTGYPGSGAIDYSCASELSFSQHDVTRDLALHLASQDSIISPKRLFMPRKEDKIPTEWLNTLKDQSSRAQLVSIHTGAMQEQDWCQIDFSEVEALALFFEANQYCLPTFLHSMPKLKVLIVYNYSSMRAIISGLPRFPSPVQIRSVLLNKLIVPSLYENCISWERLEKLSVCLCEGLGNMTLMDMELESLNFPNMMEINIDHCSDLGELPVKLCNLTSLQRLSVTNCHLIQNLPDDIGRLKSLRLLRLSACPSLSRLPPSICKLGKLEYLDISLCRCLQDLPTEFDQLSNLETLDMRECSGLKKLPTVKQRSLKRVIISDSEKEYEAWLSIKASTVHNLTIDVVPETFSLAWLDD